MSNTQSGVEFDSKDALALAIAVVWVFGIQPRTDSTVVGALGIALMLGCGGYLARSAVRDIRTIRQRQAQ